MVLFWFYVMIQARPALKHTMFSFKEIKRYLKGARKKMSQPVQEMSNFLPLDSTSSFNELLSHSEQEPVVLFKHSLTCGISSMARRRISNLDEETDPPVYILMIQHARALSAEVASHFDIRHESPQVIVVHKGKPVFHTSHGSITPQSIRDAAASR